MSFRTRALARSVIAAVLAVALVPGCRPDAGAPAGADAADPHDADADLHDTGAGPAGTDTAAAPTGGGRPQVVHPVTIVQPEPTLGVPTGELDILGRPVVVTCVECHSMLEVPPAERPLAIENLEDFHKGLEVRHGSLTCIACHDPAERQSFRLADGEPLPVTQVMDLCSQCHGPQRTDYDHGAHGGMLGYWDLTRGPRTRNGCTACHDPHVPALPKVRPTFKPVDRFLTGTAPEKGDAHE